MPNNLYRSGQLLIKVVSISNDKYVQIIICTGNHQPHNVDGDGTVVLSYVIVMLLCHVQGYINAQTWACYSLLQCTAKSKQKEEWFTQAVRAAC